MDLFIETFHRPPKICLKLQFYLFTATHSEKSGNEGGNWNQTPLPQAIPSPRMTVNHLSLFPYTRLCYSSPSASQLFPAGSLAPSHQQTSAWDILYPDNPPLNQQQITPHLHASKLTSSRKSSLAVQLFRLLTLSLATVTFINVKLTHHHLCDTVLV